MPKLPGEPGFTPEQPPQEEEEVTPVETTEQPVGSQASTDFDFRKEAGDAIDKGLEQMDQTHEELQLDELKEWRDGEFKVSMRSIVEAQQEVCAEEGNQDACAEGRQMFEEMFGESYAVEETQPAEASN